VRAQAFADEYDAGVRSRRRNPITRPEACDAGTRADNDASGRVAERHRLVQLGAHLARDLEQPFLPDLLKNAPDMIRPVAGLRKQTLARQLYDVSFSPGGK
jgi:hypothetical protein